MKRIFPILAAALIFTALVTALAGPTPTVNAQTGGLTPVEMAEAISRLGQQSLTVHVSGGLTYFALANSGSSLWGGMRFLAQAHDFVPVSAYATGISVRIEVRFVDPTVVSYMGEHRWIILDLGTWSAAFVPVLKEPALFFAQGTNQNYQRKFRLKFRSTIGANLSDYIEPQILQSPLCLTKR